MLMGNDSLESSEFLMGNNFTLLIKTDSQHNADALFTKLSNGGQITMPMKEVFWGSYYGMITDKFGIKWKLSADLKE